MGFRSKVGRVAAVVLLSASVRAGIVNADDARPGRDIHSHARPDEVRVGHVGLDLTVDFDRKELRGTAELRLVRKPGLPPGARLILDAKGLVIEAVSVAGGGMAFGPTTFDQTEEDPILGRGVSIAIPPAPDGVLLVVRVRYRTAPGAGALQWLDPARTAGGKHPFLFTQSQAIQARTWLPVQDSPGVRVTYDATIRVPAGLKAVMSADMLPQGDDPAVFRFAMPTPIPSYLIALAVGDLAFRPLGPRTGVWAEPATVEKAAREFVDTEAMIAATEERFGPYRWGRYDLLVLPPSFPFGGMENPKLTFATPTILAGDRSLVSLVAHELAHSWSGNLVTNATWRDFWLNEGFTVYLERRIIEAVYGPERAGIEAVLGIQELRDDLAMLPARDTILHIDLAGRDPDDGMTQVPYEKGALFLTEIERAFGRDRFDAFLMAYFDAHAFRSITTADFLADLRGKLFPLDPAAAARIDVDAWVNDPGLKVAHAEPTSARLDKVDRVAKEFEAGKIAAGSIPANDWTTQEWLRFLRALPASAPPAKLAELDAAFGLTRRENAEIAALWLAIAVRSDYRPTDARLESFLTTIGRRKFLMPIYRELMKSPEGKARARAIYARARPFYHPIAVESVDRLLGVNDDENRAR